MHLQLFENYMGNPIKKYLELQKLNHNHHFKYQIIIDQNLPKDLLFVPVMLTQPFVENAVLHGVSNRIDGEIKVSYLLKKNKINIEITDNGKGITKDIQRNDEKMLHTSMGTTIIKERMAHLSKSYKKKFNLFIDHAFSHNEFPGTKITLEIPLIIS